MQSYVYVNFPIGRHHEQIRLDEAHGVCFKSHFPMNLTRPTEVRMLLKKLGIRPNKALGQNFLIDRNILGILLETAELQKEDRILEIGPGLGVVTRALAPRVRRVTAIEKDPALFRFLQSQRFEEGSVELQEGDALDMDFKALRDRGINKVISNLPYGSGTRIVFELVGMRPCWDKLVFTLQQDVAERLMASPGTKEYGLISVWCQADYDISVRKMISPTCFYPVPKVQSALVELRPRTNPQVEIEDRDLFAGLLRWCFQHRRKQVHALLRKAPATFGVDADRRVQLARQLGLDDRLRPENLSVKDWGRLANALIKSGNGSHAYEQPMEFPQLKQR